VCTLQLLTFSGPGNFCFTYDFDLASLLSVTRRYPVEGKRSLFENWAWCLVKLLSKSLLRDISNELDLQTIKFISLMTGIWCLYHCHVMSWTLWVLLDTETLQDLTTTYAPLTSKVRQSHLVTKIGTSPNFCTLASGLRVDDSQFCERGNNKEMHK